MSTRRRPFRGPWSIVAWLLFTLGGEVSADVTVRVDGLSDELQRNVLAFLSIADFEPPRAAAAGAASLDDEGSEGPTEADEARIQRLHAAAPAEIATALQPFGYYEPAIEASLARSGDDWVAHYVVSAGPPTLISTLDIQVIGEGAAEPVIRAARQSIALSSGQVLRHANYEAAKRTLFDSAYNAGYIDVTYRRAELRVHRERREATIVLELDTGPRYFFGDITVEQTVLDERFIERFVPIRRGEPFDTDRLLALQIALNDSGYFDDVVIEVERSQAENRHIPIVVRTSPRRTQEYTVGFGYGTDTGPRVRLGVELRRINALGHRFNADLRLSSIEQAIAAEYRIPRPRDPVTDFLALRGSLGNQEIGDWSTRQQSLGASWHEAWRVFQRRIYLNLQREEFWTSVTPSETEAVLFAGAQFTRRLADDPIVPRRGYSWSADLRLGSDALASGTSFGRVHLTGNVVRSLGERVRVLLRGEYGAIVADEFARLPPSQRLYAGGDGSVRGYAYQALGPRDDLGSLVGGRYLLVMSAELDIRIVGAYGVALFADAGGASHSARPRLSRGFGVGARWRSPVGVVGVDIAHPRNDPDTDFRLHLSVGSDL